MLNLFRWFRKRKQKRSNEYMNVVAGMGKAKALYRSLIVFAHPDRHPEEKERYTEITNRITANRYNYNELLRIEAELTQKEYKK